MLLIPTLRKFKQLRLENLFFKLRVNLALIQQNFRKTDNIQMQTECSATRKTDRDENEAGAFSHASCLVLAGSSFCRMGNVANVANACGLVGRLQHDLRTFNVTANSAGAACAWSASVFVKRLLMCCVDM